MIPTADPLGRAATQPTAGPCEVDRAGWRGFAVVHANASRLYRENALQFDLLHVHMRWAYRHPLVLREQCRGDHCRACFPAARGSGGAWVRR